MFAAQRHHIEWLEWPVLPGHMQNTTITSTLQRVLGYGARQVPVVGVHTDMREHDCAQTRVMELAGEVR